MERCSIGNLACTVHPAGDHVVVCCHGLYSTRESKKYVEMAQRLVEAGLSCVRFDFSGCGESTGDFSYDLDERVSDLAQVMEYVTGRFKGGRYALLGSSFGGMTALRYAAHHDVAAVVIMATPSRVRFGAYEDDVRKDAARCSRVLIMHGTEDELVSPEHAQVLYELVQEPKKLMLYATDHSFSHDPERHRALDEALRWIRQYVE